MYQQVLVPLDGSKVGECAVPWARLPRRCAHVVDSRPLSLSRHSALDAEYRRVGLGNAMDPCYRRDDRENGVPLVTAEAVYL